MAQCWGTRARDQVTEERDKVYHSGHKVQNIFIFFFLFVVLLQYKKSFFIVFVTFVAFDHLVTLFTW